MDNLNLRSMTVNTATAGIALVAAATTTNIAVATKAVINGKFATALSGATTAFPTTDASTGLPFIPLAVNQATVIVYGQNLAGNFKVAQGSIEPTQPGSGTTAGDFINAPQFPVLPDDFCPLAYTLIRTSPTGSAFTFGTTNWNASGITTMVPVNVFTLPNRPVTS